MAAAEAASAAAAASSSGGASRVVVDGALMQQVQGTADEDLYLECSFNEKDEAKAHGAKWDPRAIEGGSGKWYAPAGIQLAPLSRWLPSARTFLDCPYADKEAAKALGARWDGQMQKWTVRGNTDLRPFARWLRRK